ncbi:MAG: hypothetical protein PHE58_07460 [Candidatus Omnitrophica bacterium]|nr:hypothetical protein [Candidatus Omnitrophota bacterium]
MISRLLVFLAVTSFAGVIFLSSVFHSAPSAQKNAAPGLYVPPYPYVNFIAGTFKTTAADIFFVRAILGVGEAGPEYIHYILANLRLATALDSRMIYAYIVGGVVAPRGSVEVPLGIGFLKEGMERNPLEWKLPFWIAFNYFQINDYEKAAEFYRKASDIPGAPRYLRSLATLSYYKAGKSELALAFLEGFQNSLSDPKVVGALERKITWLKNIVILEQKVAEFKSEFGRLPEDLNELVKKGLIKKIPEDTFGKGYYLDKRWYDRRYEGKVRSRLD